MLAAILGAVAQDVILKSGQVNKMSDQEILKLHERYKGLIRWLTKKAPVAQIVNPKLLDQIEKENILRLRELLLVDDEEAIILIIFASNL